MRNIIISVYKFEELSKQAKEKAREWYRENMYYPNDEDIIASIQSIVNSFTIDNDIIFDYKLDDTYSFIRICPDDGDLIHLKGKRAIAWLENNLFVNCNRHHCKYSSKQRKIINKSRLEWKNWKGLCNFTGVVYDCSLDDAYREWINEIREYPATNLCGFFTLLSLKFLNVWKAGMDYAASNEGIDEAIESNEYEFTKDGDFYAK